MLTKIKKLVKIFNKKSYTTFASILLFIFFASIKQHLYISFLLPYFLHFYVTYKMKQSSESHIRDRFGFFGLSSGCTFTQFQVGAGQMFLYKLTSYLLYSLGNLLRGCRYQPSVLQIEKGVFKVQSHVKYYTIISELICSRVRENPSFS